MLFLGYKYKHRVFGAKSKAKSFIFNAPLAMAASAPFWGR